MGSFLETTNPRPSWTAATTKDVQAWRFFWVAALGYMKLGTRLRLDGTEKGYTHTHDNDGPARDLRVVAAARTGI